MTSNQIVDEAVLATLQNITTYRSDAAQRQALTGALDAGARSEVTSGGHMDAITKLVSNVFIEAGIPAECIYDKRSKLELPGFFRAEKKWDIVVMFEGKLIAAIELKSIWGSYGNNINNRAEEAIGSATDIAKAIRDGLVGGSVPWLGYVFVLRDEARVQKATKFKEPHFPVDEEFRDASYAKRFEILCSRLAVERLYDKVWFVTVNAESGDCFEPNPEMTWAKFDASIRGKVAEAFA